MGFLEGIAFELLLEEWIEFGCKGLGRREEAIANKSGIRYCQGVQDRRQFRGTCRRWFFNLVSADKNWVTRIMSQESRRQRMKSSLKKRSRGGS